ncbi:MAG: FHA domain-containing protein [Myxococcales bacterium]|nr:FHA domain-containing protein [Myxococcales bacterium]
MDTPIWAYLAIALLLLGGVGLVVWSVVQAANRPCAKCGRQMMKEWTRCLFCGHSPTFAIGKPGLLHFVTGPLRDQVATLEKPVTTIGSVPGNDIVLNDTGVSRKHLGIRQVDGGYELADFGSTNGVFVNGEKVPRKLLSIGDIIRVGTTEMVFRT